MSIVIEVISDYLRSNRRLVVPNLGAFMVKESGERLFSDLLRDDDGVLTSLLRAKGLNELEVAVSVDRFLFEVRHNLEQYGYYRLGELGTLRLEPDTRVVRLYPSVQGEIPKHKPYVPLPILDERREVKDEREEVAVVENTTTSNTPEPPKTPTTPKRPRKRFDLVMVLAVIIVLTALISIGYGLYVANMEEIDDAAIEQMRVIPE